MVVYLTGFSTSASILKLLGLLFVFILILTATYYFTRWYAKSGFIKKGSGNIKILESMQLAPGKIIYIIKIGEKCVSVVTSKDNVVKLTELSEEELLYQDIQMNDTSFKDVMTNIVKNTKKLKDNNK